MNGQLSQLAGAAGRRVDGIDVGQLLHDLGEASAACSAVDLFGLCLSAQRVLERVHAAAPSGQPGATSLRGGDR